MKEEATQNVFAQVKHFIMTNEKHITCFSETWFNSKYLPINESNITLKTKQMFSNKFPASGVVFTVVLVYRDRIFL